MTLYRYTAVTRSGGRIEGEMEASARRTVFDQLNELGYLPVDVHEVSARQRADTTRSPALRPLIKEALTAAMPVAVAAASSAPSSRARRSSST